MNQQAFETIIGLEVHVQLATKSKAFCTDDAAFGGEPNTQVGIVSLAYPGTLPRLNAMQVEYAVRLGLALGCTIHGKSYFDRKNYFYPDLPKGYQLTQDRQPICTGGELSIFVQGTWKNIRIHHIHMEEDAGKLIHDRDDPYTRVDLNRAGVPLLEIVTEPELRSGEEVDAFMSGMRQLVRYLDISDGNMEEGSLRCDCNISIRSSGTQILNNRCEIKNLNSMRFARRAIEYEVRRQIGIVTSGGVVEQQTLHFDPVTGTTSPLRDKENAPDYRYFPDPDLPPVLLSADQIDQIAAALPELPWQLCQKFVREYDLLPADALLLSEEKGLAGFYLRLTRETTLHRAAANLVIQKIRPYLLENQLEASAFPLSFVFLAAFLQLIEAGKLSHSVAFERVFPKMISHPWEHPESLAARLDLLQSDDTTLIESLIGEVFAAFPDKVSEYRKGKKGLLGFFIGEVMKRSKGKADPKMTTALLQKKLG